MDSRKLRAKRVREEIAALRDQLNALSAEANMMTLRAQLEGELEAKGRELDRLTNGKK